jgi:hypothetical protein
MFYLGYQWVEIEWLPKISPKGIPPARKSRQLKCASLPKDYKQIKIIIRILGERLKESSKNYL